MTSTIKVFMFLFITGFFALMSIGSVSAQVVGGTTAPATVTPNTTAFTKPQVMPVKTKEDRAAEIIADRNKIQVKRSRLANDTKPWNEGTTRVYTKEEYEALKGVKKAQVITDKGGHRHDASAAPDTKEPVKKEKTGEK